MLLIENVANNNSQGGIGLDVPSTILIEGNNANYNGEVDEYGVGIGLIKAV